MKKNASLKDIAQIVGVSIPLVSYVLSNKGKENRVSEKTAKKIKEVAKKLNYQPNLNARSLKTNKTRSLGVILADISNPFFSNLARVIEDEAFSQNYTVIFGSSDENIEKFNRVLNFLKSRQVDGFIIAPPAGSLPSLIELNESKIPFVLIDRHFEELESNYVIVDNFQASYNATDYLIKNGNKRIASITYDWDLTHYEMRSKGYLKALDNAGLPKELLRKVSYGNLQNDMRSTLIQLIEEEKIEAIFFQTNSLAENGLKELFSLGRETLSKIDIVAFDKSSTYNFLDHFIPYVSQPINEMGQQAARLLIDQTENKTQDKTQIKLEAFLEKSRL